MKSILHFLVQHGYAVLFAAVLAEQIGVPLPAAPFLLAMGALAGLGNFSLGTTFALGVLACMIGDALWYALGRARGNSVLKLLCRISLEPDSCVNQARDAFGRQGSRALLIAKFVPGLSTVAPPMAGMTHMPFGRFVLADTIGSMLWVSCFLVLGFLFRDQVEVIAETVERFGTRAGFVMVGLLIAWIAFKYYQRRRFLHSLRVSRIAPGDVYELMQKGEPLAILDMRYSTREDDVTLPGAIRIGLDDLDTRHEELPRDRDIILYCT